MLYVYKSNKNKTEKLYIKNYFFFFHKKFIYLLIINFNSFIVLNNKLFREKKNYNNKIK